MSQREQNGNKDSGKKLGAAGVPVVAAVAVTVLVALFYPASESPVVIPKITDTEDDSAKRWYTNEQVAHGQKLFAQYCSGCHGENAAATPDWRKTDAAGNYPPPPLNGSAHTWHHPLSVLRETIRQGGVPMGGVMPGFADKLSAQEIDAVIAWFQSLWPDEVYQAWYRMEKESL